MRRLCCIMLVLLSSCAGPRMVQTDLYFGMSKHNGGSVSAGEWKTFREEHINRMFPDGCTIVDAVGSWRDSQTGRLITEPSQLVVFLHKPSRIQSRRIDSLRNYYKLQFDQQSVLRVDRKVKANF